MKTTRHVLSFNKLGPCCLAASLVAGALNSTAHAQEIHWSAPAPITGDSNVLNVGTPLYAYDWANNSETVNGINFSGANNNNAGGNVGTTLNSFNTTAFTSTSAPFSALSPEYQGILVGGATTTSTSAYTVTLSNLVSGHSYVVQFWVSDPRGAENARTTILSSLGGNSVTLQHSTGPGTTTGYPGQYCVGYFTNYGAPQTFTLQSPTTLAPQMNALQVLDLGQALQPNVGEWDGLAGNTLSYSALNFSTNVSTAPLGASAGLLTLAALGTPAFFGDDYYNNSTAIGVTVTNITVAAGGVTNGQIDFVNDNVNYTLTGADSQGITGATTLGTFGTGTVTLAGPNTYTGGTVIASGTLQVGAGGTSGTLGNGPVANYSSLVFDRSDNIVVTNLITGTGLVTQEGSGSLTLSNAIMGGPLTVLAQTGTGALNLAGSNTYGGSLVIAQGTVNFNGSGPGGSPYGSLYVGGNTGTATVNFNTTGTWSISTAANNVFYIGGTGASSDTSAGAFNQTAGNIMFSDGNYFTLGAGSPSCYGSYNQSGGTFTVEATEGVRIGEGGLGSFVQTGGTFYSPRYFVVGGNNTAGGSINTGVATFLGGATSMSGSYYVIIGNLNPSYGVMNIGTQAGGNGSFTAPDGTGPQVAQVSGSTGVLNLDSGTLTISGAIATGSGGNGTVNLNGGTIVASANNTLINTTVPIVNVYNGGLTVNDQAFNNLISAPMLAATGNGIYPAGGILTIPSGGGSDYIGEPIVTISGGSGSGALAIAAVSNGVVTNITMTCPGQNYQVGDTISFDFAGGSTNPASTFNYTLKASDVASNGTGGLTKIGSGSLTLSGADTYGGTTIVGAGTLAVTVDGGLGFGNVVVANGATLILTNGSTNGYMSPTANLALNLTATNNLNFVGNMTINGLSTNGGLNYVAPGVYGAVGSGAAYQLTQLTGPGLLTVSTTPVVTGVQVVLSVSPDPAVAGQTVTLTATVTGSGARPSGTVTFLNGGVVIGSAVLNSSGVATLTTTFSAAGMDSITATYSGNGTYSSASTLFASSETVTPRTDVWSGAKNGTWDINTTSNWLYLGAAAAYHNTDAVLFNDSALSNTAIAVSTTVNPNSVLFSNNVKNYTLGGNGSISGTTGLTLLGAGSVTITNTNNFTGNTILSNGVLTFSGAGSSTGGGELDLGETNGFGVLNMNSSGTLTFSGTPSIGGTSGDTNEGSGAFNQTSGTVNFATNSTDIYVELGAGGPNSYGSYVQSGGTLNILNASGTRIGFGGLGSWVQTGGTLNCSRYFVVGGNNTMANSVNDGVATFLGGTANFPSGYYLIIGNLNPSYGVLNVGTQAGGNATLISPDATGPYVAQTGGATGVLNLNSGILNVSGPIETASGGSGTVNLNGGTIQAGGDNDVLNSTVGVASVYNGGMVVDSQDFSATLSGSPQQTSGNGIYPVKGILPITGGGGSNYIGAPLVTVNGGSGSGAMAIATVSNGVVLNVAMTCPGQYYVAGDSLSFEFAGGGTATPASTFNYTLTASDVAANGTGGLTKIGTGTLALTGGNNYTGNSVVNAGTLEIDGSVSSPVIVAAGGTLDGSGTIYSSVTVQSGGAIAAGTASTLGQLYINGGLTVAGTVSLRLDNTGGAMMVDTLQGMTNLVYGGTLVVQNVTSDGTPLAVGDAFTLFGSSVYSGNFADVELPELGGGLAWNVANLAVNGSISVVGVSTTQPTVSYSLSAKTLTLAWPSDHIGWRLLEQTNNLSQGLSLNPADWGTFPDSQVTNRVAIPISGSTPAEFYRLVYP